VYILVHPDYNTFIVFWWFLGVLGIFLWIIFQLPTLPRYDTSVQFSDLLPSVSCTNGVAVKSGG
jgi:hypothetical protein